MGEPNAHLNLHLEDGTANRSTLKCQIPEDQGQDEQTPNCDQLNSSFNRPIRYDGSAALNHNLDSPPPVLEGGAGGGGNNCLNGEL